MHVARLSGEARQQGEDGAHLVGRRQVMLPGRNEAEPGVPGRRHLLHAVLDFLLHGLARQVLVGNEESQFHGCSLRLQANKSPIHRLTIVYQIQGVDVAV